MSADAGMLATSTNATTKPPNAYLIPRLLVDVFIVRKRSRSRWYLPRFAMPRPNRPAQRAHSVLLLTSPYRTEKSTPNATVPDESPTELDRWPTSGRYEHSFQSPCCRWLHHRPRGPVFTTRNRTRSGLPMARTVLAPTARRRFAAPGVRRLECPAATVNGPPPGARLARF